MTAYELGLDLPYTSVDLFKGEHKAKEYIDTKHPFGMVVRSHSSSLSSHTDEKDSLASSWTMVR